MADQKQNDDVQRDEGLTEGLNMNEASNTLLSMFEESEDFLGELDGNESRDEQDDVEEDDDVEQDDTEEVDDDFDEEDFDEDEDDEDVDESEGDGTDEDDDEDPDSDAEPTYKVKVQGEEKEVPLSELTSGYMRQQDYTQKTMAVAEDRKAIREQEAELLRLEQEYEENLELVTHVLTGGLGLDPNWPEIKARTDPDEYKALREAWMEREDQITGLKAERARVQQDRAKRMKSLKDARVAEEADKLRAAIPDWIDESVARADLERIGRTATLYGISPEEFSNLIDHRIILILRDAERARKMDEAAEKGEQVRRKTRKKTTTVKSTAKKSTKKGSKVPKQARAARRNLAKSGAIRDAEASLVHFFENE